MKYLRNDLREEYERIAKNVPDIEGLQHPLINFSDVLHAYFILADYFTDESSDNIEHMLVGLIWTAGAVCGRAGGSRHGHLKNAGKRILSVI